MNKDTWVGIIGAAILVTAMVAVFAYERGIAPSATAAAAAANETMPTHDGSVALGATDTNVLAFTATGVVGNVTFHVTWKATNGKDTIHVEVAPPTGSGITQGAQDMKDTGDVTLTVPVPAGATVLGGWQLKITFTQATPAPLPGGIPPPTPPPGSTDTNVSYHATTSVT